MIASNGKALMKILVPERPTAQEAYAASELRHYLNLMTSAGFEVASKRDGPVIAVGAAAEAALGVAFDQALGEDAFTVRAVGGDIAVVGGRRGVIYGAYELLEAMGCRFFTSTCEKVPCLPELPAPSIDTTQKPAFEYRRHDYKDIAQSPRFAVKCRANGEALPEEYGGGITYAWYVHSFAKILDADEWFDSHPDYFSMVGGKRVRDFTQLCLTHPDVLRIAVDKVRAALRAHPECRIISVSPNDWYNNCECPSCAKIDAIEGSNAGSLIWFVNQVAEQIEGEFPQVIIDTLAYQYSRQAPKHVRPRGNVCVRLCSIESCFSHSFESCDDESRRTARPDGTKTSFLEDLREWAGVCGRLYIWDYTTGFAHYPAPHANWNVLQPNMQCFAKNNVKGLYEQPCYAHGGSTDLNELRAYLVCKLMWDPYCDVERHRSEFVEHYYGAAGGHILSYIDALVGKVERDNIHIGFKDECDMPHFTDEMLDVYDGILEGAERAVAGDPLRLARVAKARLSHRWVRMKNRQMRDGAVDPTQVNQFFEDWRAHGLTRIDEWVSAETTLRAFLDNKWRGVEYYRHWTDEGDEKL